MKNNQKIIDELHKAYWAEMETVMNYLAHATNLDGVSAEEIKEKLNNEINDELGHAKKIASRIKELNGKVDGSDTFSATQKSLQAIDDTTDVKYVIDGVIDAENEAINTYKNIIKISEGNDFVTQDLATQILADEETHKTVFEGFKKEFVTSEVELN
jgi:bacterioferritin